MIPVTKTFFPTIKEYNVQLKRIWENQWLTNRGELVKELEDKLKTYLGIQNITLTTNGTLPIQIALNILGEGGEIITTPFSYVATTSSIVWEGCIPVFVDIHPEYLTIDETKLEAAITSKTTAILATHVFGNPCNVEVIQNIANKYNLKVIYDAAHCFGVNYKGKSIFDYGDVSTCSFHATKVFHTGEGGAIFCRDKNLDHKLFYSHNFGHNGPEDFHDVGINAKMSELQAAMGLCVLDNMEFIKEEREKIVNYYNENLNFHNLRKMTIREDVDWNFSYYPVVFIDEENLLRIKETLNNKGVFPRRYFYPSLNKLKYLRSTVKMEVSEAISKSILCLPLYAGLTLNDCKKIVSIINDNS